MVKRGNNKQVSKSQTDKLLIATITLLTALFIMNLITLTGYSTKFSTGNSYYGESNCFKVGGIQLREGVSVNHEGKNVVLVATGQDIVAVNVDGVKRTIEAGHEVWINGVTVTNFVSTDVDACLILK